MMNRAIGVLLLLFFGFPCCWVYGQTQQHQDFSGHIVKYDSTFSGVGPRVYFLPPPRSQEELLADRIEQKHADSLNVAALLAKQQYHNRLKNLANTTTIAAERSESQSREGTILLAIDRIILNGTPEQLAGLYNQLAGEYLQLGKTADAQLHYEQILTYQQEKRDSRDLDIVTHNLAITYEYLGDLATAGRLHREIYARAQKSHNRLQQAFSLMELATIKAKQGQIREGEQDIIQRVFPLCNSLRSDPAKIAAYLSLAKVYLEGERYPEAQWFLVLAKELADKQTHTDRMLEIIFNLAEVKKKTGNNRVAISEYLMADSLARQTESLVLQLAIQDALGDLHHQEGNFPEAETALKNYDTLKHQVFNSGY